LIRLINTCSNLILQVCELPHSNCPVLDQISRNRTKSRQRSSELSI
jgi:hypothetical protein